MVRSKLWGFNVLWVQIIDIGCKGAAAMVARQLGADRAEVHRPPRDAHSPQRFVAASNIVIGPLTQNTLASKVDYLAGIDTQI